MAKIFISYRRTDSAAYAGRLFDRLRKHYGDAEVFMDLEGIEPGAEFGKVIGDKARAAEVLIALIGKDWVTSTHPDGTRRLDDPNDLVVREIETGLAANVRVIPVLAGKASMPLRQELPERIAALAERNAIELSDQRFHADVDRLIQVIDRSVPGARPRGKVRWALAAAAVVAALIVSVWLLRDGDTASAGARPDATVVEKATQPAATVTAAAAAAVPPNWEQIRALPVIYAETFDPATVLDIWKPQSPPRPPWTEELRNGRYCTTNRSDDSAIHYIHVSVDKHDMNDAPVFMRVQAEGANPTAFSGGGVLYRFDGAARTYYALVLSPSGQVTFWRRDKDGLTKLFAGTVPRTAPGQPTMIGVVGRGSRLFLFADDTLMATVEDGELARGLVGAIALSKGRFCFDDFTVRTAAPR